MFAAQNGNEELVEYLVGKKCELKSKSVRGRTALRIAMEAKLSPTLAEYLKSHSTH